MMTTTTTTRPSRTEMGSGAHPAEPVCGRLSAASVQWETRGQRGMGGRMMPKFSAVMNASCGSRPMLWAPVPQTPTDVASPTSVERR